MTLSVVLLNHHNPPLLRLSLTTLARALGRTFSGEVIVIDSDSSIETQNVVRHDCANLFERLTFMPFKENTGYTRGINTGLRHAIGDYILILNPDIVLLPGAVEHMIAYMEEHPRVGMLGPGLLNFDDTRQDSCFRFYTPWIITARRVPFMPMAGRITRRFLMHGEDLTGPTPVDWLMGSAVLVRRSAMERTGLMDERFFHYMSDVDWARSFWENGYQVVYFPNAQMYHYHQRQSKGRFGVFDAILQRQTLWHIRDGIRYFLKHGISGHRPRVAQPVQPKLMNA
jgi:N-acetylglucosaminyl-diphospho-decaprenol L-rhamnosyltransferase